MGVAWLAKPSRLQEITGINNSFSADHYYQTPFDALNIEGDILIL